MNVVMGTNVKWNPITQKDHSNAYVLVAIYQLKDDARSCEGM